jgi:hypothetical protein
MKSEHVEIICEEQSIRSFALYVQRAKRRRDQAQEDYDEALDAYDKMVKVLRNKLDAYYYGNNNGG